MSPDDCRSFFEMLSEYIDGELPADACEKIEHHIADCAPCIQFVESLRKSVNTYRHFKPAEDPEPLTPEVRERLTVAYREMLARHQHRVSP